MKRILMALSASTVLSGAILAPTAGAAVSPGHGPGATASRAGHDINSPVKTSSDKATGSPVKASPVKAADSPVRASFPGVSFPPIKVVSLAASLSQIKVVSLGAGFSPSSVALAPGEPLIIIVSHSVRARLEIASGGSLVYDGHEGDVYLFFARKPGMSAVSAQVRPRCAAKVCPQWRTAPDLMVTTY